MDELRRFGISCADAMESWQLHVRRIAEDREARAAEIEAQCGGQEIVLTAWMKLIASVGFALGGGRRG